MLYELRIYTIAQGRRKDIEDLFEHTNLPNFKKHGVPVLGVWYAAEESRDALYYILQFDDLTAKYAKWKEFYAEPGWQADIAEFQKKGDVVLKHDSQLMSMVPFFPNWKGDAQ